MNYSRQDVRIHTKLTDETTIAQMAKIYSIINMMN